MIGFGSEFSQITISMTGSTTCAGRSRSAPGGESFNQAKSRAVAALADIAAAGHRLPAVVSHGNLIASVLQSMDAAFGFAQWQGLGNPDLFEVELEASRPVKFVWLNP